MVSIDKELMEGLFCLLRAYNYHTLAGLQSHKHYHHGIKLSHTDKHGPGICIPPVLSQSDALWACEILYNKTQDDFLDGVASEMNHHKLGFYRLALWQIKPPEKVSSSLPVLHHVRRRRRREGKHSSACQDRDLSPRGDKQ